MIDLDELERMVAEATPGPWVQRKALIKSDGEYDFGIGAFIGGKQQCIAEFFGRSSWSDLLPAEANARLIAAAREALPALIERVRRAEEALKPLSEAYIGGWSLPLRGADAIVSVTVQDALTARAHFAAYRKETDNAA